MKKKINEVVTASSRRDFLKRSALLGMAAGLAPLQSAISAPVVNTDPEPLSPSLPLGNGKVTLLYTSDIHAQLHTHDEF